MSKKVVGRPRKALSFEERIEYMESHIEAFKWESCAKILVYLRIFGPMAATDLRDKLGLKGEKSLYRSINKLVKINYITKIKSAKDKRSVIYKILPTFVNDPEFDEPFLEYLRMYDRLNLISDYLAHANYSSITFLKAITEIMQETQEKDPRHFQKRFLEPSIFFETIFSVKNAKKLTSKIFDFLQTEIVPLVKSTGYDGKHPIDDPAAFYISFMPI